MNDQQILLVIKDYIQNRSINQALMITGEWGCGKSYFVKNSVKEYLRKNGILDNKNYIVFSLYGINNLVDFKTSFYDEIFINQYLGESNKARKTKNICERLFNSVSSTIDTSAIGIPVKINLAELIHKSDLVQLENCIFVFDDIERCELSATELWGFINKLTENRGIPVITVANESKILEKDLENDNYKIEKEKAVYCTLAFSYEIANIFDELVNEYEEKDIREYISSNKKIILEEIFRRQPNNIRTLKFVLVVLVNLLREIYNLEAKSFLEHSELYNKFLKYIVLRAIQYKVNPKIETNWGKNDFGFIYRSDDNDDDAKELIWGFKFIDTYINTTYLDIELLKLTYKNELELYESKSLAFNRLFDWAQLNDECVCRLLDKLKDELINNKYNVSMIPNILWRIASIKYYTKLEYDYDKFIEDIKVIIKDDSITTKDILLNQYKIDPVYKIYEVLSTPLIEIAEENYKQSLERLFLYKRLSNPNILGLDILKYIKDNLEEYYTERRFAPFLGEIEEIHKYFLKANESDIDNFRHIIRLVYLQISNINTILEADVEYLEQLLVIVKEKVEDKKNGAIMNFNINCLQKDLELAIKALKEKENK